MIRPIIMQGLVQRSQDVSNMKQGENIRPAVEQNNINIRQEKEIRQKSEQVVKKDDSVFGNPRFDAKEKGSNQYEHQSGKEKKEKENDQEDGKVTLKHIGGFDASI